jgi:hypothetical protein
MRKILGIAVVAVFLGAATAQAQGPAPSGFSLGARLGYGIPLGDADGGDPIGGVPPAAMTDLVSGQIPIQLDVTYRFNPNWQVGLYFQYGIAFPASSFCPTGASCSGSNVRFGAEAMYTFPSQGFSPWLGLGLGFEWQNLFASAGGVSADFQVSGFEYLIFQAGGDWHVSPNFKMGPFLSFSFGSYDSLKVTALGVTQSGSIANTTTHEWLQLGLKGTFDL